MDAEEINRAQAEQFRELQAELTYPKHVDGKAPKDLIPVGDGRRFWCPGCLSWRDSYQPPRGRDGEQMRQTLFGRCVECRGALTNRRAMASSGRSHRGVVPVSIGKSGA